MGSGSPVGFACHVAFSNTDIHSDCSSAVSQAMCHGRLSRRKRDAVRFLGAILLDTVARAIDVAFLFLFQAFIRGVIPAHHGKRSMI